MTPILLLLTSMFASSAFAVPAEADQHDQSQPNTEWKSLFNGTDLTGWTVECQPQDKEKNYWSVDNGSILINSMGDKDHNYHWLQTTEEFADFELKLDFQVYEGIFGNSGVQIRSRYDRKAGWLDGPQVDIHPPANHRAGKIYDETRGTKRWIDPDLEQGNYNVTPDMANPAVKLRHGENTWNQMHILAEGTRIRVWVNGVLATDYDGSGILDDANHRQHNVGLQGHIALQLHNKNELKARFKNIRIREL